MILTATTHSIELETSAAVSVDWCTAWVDHTASGGTPGSNQGNVATATTTAIAAAPAASTQRQIKFVSLRNRGAASTTVVVKKDVSGTEYHLSPPISLAAGETATWTDHGGWQVLDASGRPRVSTVAPLRAGVLLPAAFATANLTSAKTITSNSTFAVYMGRAPAALASVQVRYRVTTAAATITWAELAIAKGTVNVGGNPTLTVVGYADVSAVVNSTGQKTTTVNVSAGQAIVEGDDLWLLVGNSATTALQVRAQSIADDLQVGLQASLATRPSTNVGTTQAYTIEGATTLAPWAAIIL